MDIQDPPYSYSLPKRSIVISAVIHIFLLLALSQWNTIYYRNRLVGKKTGEKMIYFTLEEPEITKPDESEGEPLPMAPTPVRPERPVPPTPTVNQPLPTPPAPAIPEPIKVITPPPIKSQARQELMERMNRILADNQKPETARLPEKEPAAAELFKPTVTVERNPTVDQPVEIVKTDKREIIPVSKPSTVSKPAPKTIEPEAVIGTVTDAVDNQDMRVMDQAVSAKNETLREKSISEFLRDNKNRDLTRDYHQSEFDRINREEESTFDATQFKGMTLSNYGWDWEPYLRNLRRHIKFHWYPPEAFRTYGLCSGNTVIRFRMDKQGNMLEMKVLHEEGTGDPYALKQIHLASSDAIRGSNPLPALPADFPDKTLDITVAFYYLKSQDRQHR